MEVMKTPRVVNIAITGKCNARCLYCSHFDSNSDVEKDIDADEWITFFSELNKLGVMRVILHGGEPFIRNDILEIIDGIVRNRMRFSILSNGALIDTKSASFLAQTNRCDGVQISVDGSCSHVHDVFRGSGSFSKAIAGIKCLQTNGVAVTARVTIHPQNVGDLEDVIKFLLEHLKLASVSTNSAGYLGMCRKEAPRFELSVEDRVKAMEILVRLKRAYQGRIRASSGPLREAELWTEMENARQNGTSSISERGYLSSCQCSFSAIDVRADGVMVPCGLLSHVELGRINRDSLQYVWLHHPELNSLRNRTRISLLEFSQCRECEYVQFCAGSCPALVYNREGRMDRPGIDACFKQFLDDGGRLPNWDDYP